MQTADTIETRGRVRRRHQARLGMLRQRAALASALGFAAFLGLAAQHAVGSSKQRVTATASPGGAAPATYFDERSDGFAFDDGSSEPSFSEDGGSSSPPVAQSSVS